MSIYRSELDESYEVTAHNFQEFKNMVYNSTHNVRTYREIAEATKTYDYLFIQTNEDINSFASYPKTVRFKVSFAAGAAPVAAESAKMMIWDDAAMTSTAVDIKEFLLEYFHHFANVDKIHEKICKNEKIEFKELYRNKKTTFLAFIPSDNIVYSDKYCEYMEKNHDSYV